MTWDAEKRQKAVELYMREEPTPETSTEIVKQVANDLGESPNGVRLILTKEGVYVKKAVSASTPKSTSGGTRVSKAAAIEALSAAISDLGEEVDEDIVNKLTGKAAQYFANLLNKSSE